MTTGKSDSKEHPVPVTRNSRGSTSGFIAAAIAVHGERYSYGRVEYVNNSTKVSIVCPVHGAFQQTPGNHLAGKGCRKCASQAAANRYRKRPESFLAQAQRVHGNEYDYSNTVYSGARDKLTIECRKHGKFEQQAGAHLAGQGCPRCAHDRASTKLNLTTDEFVRRAQEKFGDRFDYSQVNYVDSWTPVEIRCREHGPFLQSPVTHVHSATHGCPSCARNSVTDASRLQQADFIERANAVHHGKFDYSKALVVDSKTKVRIVCPRHGMFNQTPNQHLAGAGCPKCRNEGNANRQRQPVEQFVRRAQGVHGDKYDYARVDYRSARKQIVIVCPIHGAFNQTPDMHLKSGCRRCADDALPGAYTEKRFSDDAKLGDSIGTIYYAQFTADDGEAFYKVGISRNTAIKRFAGYGGSYGYQLHLLKAARMPLRDAFGLEQKILGEFGAAHGYTPLRRSRSGRRFGGRNECFDVPLPAALIALLVDSAQSPPHIGPE